MNMNTIIKDAHTKSAYTDEFLKSWCSYIDTCMVMVAENHAQNYAEIVEFMTTHTDEVNQTISDKGWGIYHDIWTFTRDALYAHTMTELNASIHDLITAYAAKCAIDAGKEEIPDRLWDKIEKEMRLVTPQCTRGYIESTVKGILTENGPEKEISNAAKRI